MYKNFFKRVFDIIFALLLSPFAVLAVLICALPICLYDRGPVFYLAQRRGKNGRRFKMIKLRTMYVDSEDLRNSDGSTYSADDDSRVTPFGRLLRRLSIDELPQIFNVLKGDMSFIGPRPHLATAELSELDEARIKRLRVRPGITGYSQAYFRNSIGMQKKIEYDCFYVDNVSLWLDIKIAFKTIATVLSRKNINGDGK